MKIGFFIDQAYPGGYGVEISMETFKKKLEELGHETYVYAPRDKEIVDDRKNIFRFKAWRVKKNPKMFFSFPCLPASKSFREVLNFRLDIAHAQSPLNLGLLAKRIARHQKIPIICTVHTDFPAWIRANLKEKFLLPRLTEWWLKCYSNQMDAVIAPSSKIKNTLERVGVKKPIHILANCVDLELFRRDKSGDGELRRRFDIPEAAKVLVFVGSLSRQKNVGFLIRALAEILKTRKDVFLLLVGAGDYKKDLQKISAELSLDGNVRFAGFVPHEAVTPYYNMSDVFVMASLSEVMPLVILEAQACGLPVVVLDEAAFYDTINSGENGFLVKEEKPALFAENVLKLLSDREVYGRFSEAALRKAGNFSIDKQTNRLLEIYQSVIQIQK